ncbi:S-layer homology domain-containing protein [Bacillus sp. HMF5848]|uniref:S-layer homology domain-containing protein n=1 Tax=Bacillus sp. HMF5848 TaxID=2495421 RepID=UPI000F79B740|nr:S-layer homology domain-containing protein [Bacillus sp. HMF5848]RSK26719.1 S-layer homology domain-containing protein [Bacillus sp. HMF5848]
MIQFIHSNMRKQGQHTEITLYVSDHSMEFADELGNRKEKTGQYELEKSARNYVSKNFPNVKNATIKIVAGSMLIGTLTLGTLTPKAGAEEQVNQTQSNTNSNDSSATGSNDTQASNDTNETPTNSNTVTGDSQGDDTNGDTTFPVKDVVDFKDVSDEDEFYKYIKDLAAYGVIQGVQPDKYGTYDNITRAQAAKIIAKVAGIEVTDTNVDPGFRDVVKGGTDAEYGWAYPYVAALQNAGVIKGYEVNGENEFRPRDPVTREQMAKMLANAFALNGDELITEGEGANWSDPYIQLLIDAGITSYDSPDEFRKTEATKRGQLAKFVYETRASVGYVGLVETVTDSTITISGVDYPLTDNVKKILNPANEEFLQNADISVGYNDAGEINEVLWLSIIDIDDEGGLVNFDGQDATIKDVYVFATNVNIENLNVEGDLTIYAGETLEATNVNVGARTIYVGDEDETADEFPSDLVFADSKLGLLYLAKHNLNFTTKGTTTIHKMFVEGTNMSIEAPNITVEKFEIADNAELKVAPGLHVNKLVVPAGKAAADVITNYDDILSTVKQVGDTDNPSHTGVAKPVAFYSFIDEEIFAVAGESETLPVTATAYNVPADTKLLYKITLLQDGEPLTDQEIYYEGGDIPIKTDIDGVALFGPADGFTAESVNLADGATQNFTTTFLSGGNYELHVQLVDAVDKSLAIGAQGTQHIYVGEAGNVTFDFGPDFDLLKEGEATTFNLTATASDINETIPMQFKILLTDIEGTPLANQKFSYTTIEGNPSSFETNQEGEAIFGPQEGFTVGALNLQGGVTIPVTINMHESGRYVMDIGLVTKENPDIAVGEFTEKEFTVNAPGDMSKTTFSGFDTFVAGTQNEFAVNLKAENVTLDDVSYKAMLVDEDENPVTNYRVEYYDNDLQDWIDVVVIEDEMFFGPYAGIAPEDTNLASGEEVKFRASIDKPGTYNFKVAVVDTLDSDVLVDDWAITTFTVATAPTS